MVEEQSLALFDFLRSKEIAHNGLTELIVVDSMHERKTKMNDLWTLLFCQGLWNLEEFFEMLTWAQLGLHKTNRSFKY
jgi:predicted Rossmann-fold nucleotide-binding protein